MNVGGRIINRDGGNKRNEGDDEEILLKSTEIKGSVTDYAARVSISQTFVNSFNTPIEAVFQFMNIPSGLGGRTISSLIHICSFDAMIEREDGSFKEIKGKCVEREEAVDTYDDSISSGHGAFLFVQDPDPKDLTKLIFTCSLGNLAPSKQAIVSFSYVQELRVEIDPNSSSSFIAFELFNGASGHLSLEDSNSSSEVTVLPEIEVTVDMSSEIKNVTSPTHPISFTFSDQSPDHRLGKAVLFPDKGDLSPSQFPSSFVLQVQLRRPHEPCPRIVRDQNGHSTGMVAVYPLLESREEMECECEIIFLIDRSGSMSGGRLKKVKDAMQIMMRSLPAHEGGILFNIIGFGSRSSALFESGSKTYDEQSMRTATDSIAQMSSNFGGTELLMPLKDILVQQPTRGLPRQLFIMTDGEVSNPKECIDEVNRSAKDTRVFTFGIGSEASMDLVRGLAVAGNGEFEMINTVDEIEGKVLSQLKSALRPALTDITVQWDFDESKSGFSVQKYCPHLPTPLFSGQRFIHYAMLENKGKEPQPDEVIGHVTVAAMSGRQKAFRSSMDIIAPKTENDSSHISTLAAATLVKEFENGFSYMHEKRGSLSARYSPQDVKNAAIALSIQYQIMCSYTSFVAVEERGGVVLGEMSLKTMKQISKHLDPKPSFSSSYFSGGGSGGFRKSKKKSKKKSKPRMPSDLSNLRDVLDKLDKRESLIQKKMDKEVAMAKSHMARKDKRTALACLKRKKHYESQMGNLWASRVTVEQQVMTLEDASVNSDTICAMRSGAFALKCTSNPQSIENVDSLMDSIQDQFDIANEINEALHEPTSALIDEEELLDELDDIAEEELDDLALDTKSDERALPQKAKPPSSTRISGEEEELAALLLAFDGDEPKKQTEKPFRISGGTILSTSKHSENFPSLPSASTLVRNLILEQQFPGNWKLAALHQVISRFPDQETLRKRMPASSEKWDDIWATALAIAYLEIVHSSEKISWDMVVAKAKRWLIRQQKKEGCSEIDFLGAAEKIVSEFCS